MHISSPSTARSTAQPTVATSRARIDVLLLAGILIVGLLLRLPGLALPLERDEGAYAYVAWTWLHGGLPYRDVFDHKPPLIYLLYMPALLVSPPSAWAIRVWATILFLGNVTLVYLIGRQVWERRTALTAALIFAVAGSAFDLQGLILNTGQALVLPALIGLWCAIRFVATSRRRFAIGVGAAITATILVKPVAVVLIPVMLLACRPRVRDVARVYGFVALGAAIVGLPIVASFALRGGWRDLVFDLLTYNTIYAQESQQRWLLGPLVDMFAPFMPLLLAAIGGTALLTIQRHALSPPVRRSGWLVVGWFVALLLSAIGSLRAFVHYYYPSLPLMALLAAPCITWLWRRADGATIVQRAAHRLAPLLLVALLIAPLGLQNLSLIGTTATQQTERLYGDVGKNYFAEAGRVAEFVRSRTRPADNIYIFAAEPEVYLLAERRPSSRYIYDYPLALIPNAQSELRRDLAAKPPALVITYFGVRPDGFRETINAQKFQKIAEIGGYEVFGPP